MVLQDIDLTDDESDTEQDKKETRRRKERPRKPATAREDSEDSAAVNG